MCFGNRTTIHCSAAGTRRDCHVAEGTIPDIPGSIYSVAVKRDLRSREGRVFVVNI